MEQYHPGRSHRGSGAGQQQWTYGNPNYAFSYSNLSTMNNQGLAVGINQYGVIGPPGRTAKRSSLSNRLTVHGGHRPRSGLESRRHCARHARHRDLGQSHRAVTCSARRRESERTIGQHPVSLQWENADTHQPDQPDRLDEVDQFHESPAGQSPTWIFGQRPRRRLDNDGRILVQANQSWR